MPQMSPMLWLVLMVLFLFVYFGVLVIVYFGLSVGELKVSHDNVHHLKFLF